MAHTHPPSLPRGDGERGGSQQSAGSCSQLVPRTQGHGLAGCGEQGATPAACPSPRRRLTFDGDDMLADLVLQHRLLHPLQQLVDGVDVGVHRLEALDLGPDGCRVGQLLLVVHGAAAPLRRLLPLRLGAFPLPSPHRDPRAGRRAAAGGGGACRARGRAPAAASLTGPPRRPPRAGPAAALRLAGPQGAPPPPPFSARCHFTAAAGQGKPAAPGPMEGGSAASAAELPAGPRRNSAAAAGPAAPPPARAPTANGQPLLSLAPPAQPLSRARWRRRRTRSRSHRDDPDPHPPHPPARARSPRYPPTSFSARFTLTQATPPGDVTAQAAGHAPAHLPPRSAPCPPRGPLGNVVRGRWGSAAGGRVALLGRAVAAGPAAPPPPPQGGCPLSRRRDRLWNAVLAPRVAPCAQQPLAPQASGGRPPVRGAGRGAWRRAGRPEGLLAEHRTVSPGTARWSPRTAGELRTATGALERVKSGG